MRAKLFGYSNVSLNLLRHKTEILKQIPKWNRASEPFAEVVAEKTIFKRRCLIDISVMMRFPWKAFPNTMLP